MKNPYFYEAYKNQKIRFAIVTLCTIAFFILESIFIVFYNELFSYLKNISLGNWSIIVLPVSILATIWLGQNIISFLSEFLRIRVEYEYANKRIIAIFAKILSLKQSFLNEKNTGEITSRTIEDSKIAYNSFLKPVFEVLNALGTFVATSVTLFLLSSASWKPAIIVISMVIVFAFLSWLTTSRIEKLTEKAREESSNLWESFYDSTRNIKFIKINNLQAKFIEQTSSLSTNYQKSNLRVKKYSSILNFVESLSFVISWILVLIVSLYFYINDPVSVPLEVVISFGASFYGLRFATSKFIDEIVVIKELRVSMNRIQEMFNYPSESINYKELSIEIRGEINLSNLSFKHGERKNIYNNLNFIFEQGKHYVITGETGSGKSTLVDLITGCYEDYEGKIIFDKDIVMNEHNLMSIRKSISICYQFPFLFDDTLFNNIKILNNNIDNREMEEIIKICHVDKIISRLPKGINTNIGEGGIILSGGERKRIQLAQSLAKKSNIYIFDELTSSLDDETARDVINSVNKYLRNKTVIYIEHRSHLLLENYEKWELVDGELYRRN